MVKVAVTGHRPADLFGYGANEGWAWLHGELHDLLEGLAASEALSGMALGADQVFMQAALELGIPVVAYVPFEGQECLWPAASQAAYRELLGRCTRRVVVGVPSRQAFLDRNRAMVEAADVVVAVWTGKRSGGTFHAVSLALQLGKDLVWVDPVARQVWLVGAVACNEGKLGA